MMMMMITHGQRNNKSLKIFWVLLTTLARYIWTLLWILYSSIHLVSFKCSLELFQGLKLRLVSPSHFQLSDKFPQSIHYLVLVFFPLFVCRNGKFHLIISSFISVGFIMLGTIIRCHFCNVSCGG